MAVPKKARVVKKQIWHDDVCHVTCQMIEPEELGFVGGQYIIVNTGQLMPNGKLGKRAYSICSPDTVQNQFVLVVKKIGKGVGSNFICDIQENDEFEFSGPWGKYKPTEEHSNESILCVATDTGITAALGLLKGQKMQESLASSHLMWFVESENYFIPEDIVKEWVPQRLAASFPLLVSSTQSDDRSDQVIQAMKTVWSQNHFSKVYLSGDGNILSEIKNWLLARGLDEEQIITESFFHHERLKTASTVKA